jgi:hypothetical protein
VVRDATDLENYLASQLGDLWRSGLRNYDDVKIRNALSF